MRKIINFLCVFSLVASHLHAQVFSNLSFKAQNIQLTQLEIHGNYDQFGITKIKYGIVDPLPLDANTTVVNGTKFIKLQNLLPATTYKVEFQTNSGSVVGKGYYSTAANSKGEIRVYFNHRIDASFQTSNNQPNGTEGSFIVDEVITLINNAKTSIEVCLYNNDRTNLVSALRNAKSRGLKVRYIADDETANSALSPTPNFPVLEVNADGLMHNKFIVIDADSDTTSWVIGGSMNFTTGNIYSDFNNTIFVQDKSLARNYRTEFEEMWGGTAATPNLATSKSGNDKQDNTAHQFNIKGVPLEQFFSPSDNLTANIVQTINTANHDLRFALLTFTKSEIATEILNRHLAGVEIKGICDNSSDPGSQINGLISNGVNVLVHTPSNQIHHKYAVIDAQDITSDPIVLTGSHNWTNAAEFNNDENTMIWHSPRIANLFLQEFEGRWCEMTVPNCILANRDVELPENALAIFPNPTDGLLNFHWTLSDREPISLSLFDLQGRLLKSVTNIYPPLPAWSVDHLPQGTYFIKAQQGFGFIVKKFQVF